LPNVRISPFADSFFRISEAQMSLWRLHTLPGFFSIPVFVDVPLLSAFPSFPDVFLLGLYLVQYSFAPPHCALHALPPISPLAVPEYEGFPFEELFQPSFLIDRQISATDAPSEPVIPLFEHDALFSSSNPPFQAIYFPGPAPPLAAVSNTREGAFLAVFFP